ncbi:MAG TPA: aconitate hydratase AcnA [Dehalococcoidia bacterium]|nr:aconitate hydratase AcnA [Dehalococcoidia bacterium]
MTDPFGAIKTLETRLGTVRYYSLQRLADLHLGDIERLPFSVRIVLENLLRRTDGHVVTEDDVRALAGWAPDAIPDAELPFLPARVLLQDFTGIPVVADLAALRDEMARQGGDPQRVNPDLLVDLVIDHSVQVDAYGRPDAFRINVDREFERNRERYAFLRWAQQSVRNFRVVPPGAGIVHQVNLEFLAPVVQVRSDAGDATAFPDTLVGTDSHTTMINGLGVLGWGVGGIEAEAAMLNQPLPLLAPQVVGVRLTGALREGVTATDLVLTLTEMLRKHGVVGKFVEYCGPGLSNLALADRATIANMSPEYGATCGYFPVDAETLRYLQMTGRDPDHIDLVERYCRAQGLFREDTTPDPEFTELLALDLHNVEASLAGPRRPQDRVPIREVQHSLRNAFADEFPGGGAKAKERFDWEGGTVNEEDLPTAVTVEANARPKAVPVSLNGERVEMHHGDVVIAAITSCTNTSNPSVMLAAGLVAKKAVERGLKVEPYVKTSLAPGSRAVIDYLKAAGLLEYLERLHFDLVGFGCTTCIGNSGPLDEPVAKAVDENKLVVAAVLSGNRNFEGRIHPQVRASYLASPPLVVAYALAGTVDIILQADPVGAGRDGQPVFLQDIWPTNAEVAEAVGRSVSPDIFGETYAHIFDGEERWASLDVPEGALYRWDEASTYLRRPPFVEDLAPEPPVPADITGARVLVMVGDSVTTDHISPAGAIAKDSPAGRYLEDRNVPPREFNSYGSRRGNHETMMRGTFANIRLRNEVAPGTEGGWTRHWPEGDEATIYEASRRYWAEGIPLIVIAGKEYGTGSSRDWAAKGVALLGVRACIAESYERIHRSNLIGMGVLPLQFQPGESRTSLSLTGDETYRIEGLSGGITPRMSVTVTAARPDGSEVSFQALVRLDSPLEAEQYRHGGILPLILRKMLRGSSRDDGM